MSLMENLYCFCGRLDFVPRHRIFMILTKQKDALGPFGRVSTVSHAHSAGGVISFISDPSLVRLLS